MASASRPTASAAPTATAPTVTAGSTARPKAAVRRARSAAAPLPAATRAGSSVGSTASPRGVSAVRRAGRTAIRGRRAPMMGSARRAAATATATAMTVRATSASRIRMSAMGTVSHRAACAVVMDTTATPGRRAQAASPVILVA